MHIISKIIDAKPYRIVVEFDSKDKRIIDFTSIFESFPALKDEKVFTSVSLDSYPTIKWDGFATMQDYSGELIAAPLDFCPDALYRIRESA
ncbi:MAG: DUF2442 domain-containing protein [Chitinophagales bacterium]|nr:DUF2442 domain-containing protein [Chitinophagales bacterium]